MVGGGGWKRPSDGVDWRLRWEVVELALFPLQMVLFPGRALPLHLFEPRYRQMLADCLDGARRFGVVAIRTGREVGEPGEVHEVGTVAVIDIVQRLRGGRANIVTRGCDRFRINRLLHDRPYLRAEVTLLPERRLSDRTAPLVEPLRAALIPYLHALGVAEEYCDSLPQDAARLSYLAASTLQVEVPQLQELLELDDPIARLRRTLELLRRESTLLRHLGTCGTLRPADPRGADLN